MKHRVAAAALACLALSAPAWAGLHYVSVTNIKSDAGTQVMRAEGWVEGDNAKVAFLESDNPLMAEGAYLLTTDGGKTMVLVNPEEKTYAPFDLSAMAQTAGAMMKGLGGLVKMNVSNQKVEKLAEEPGPQVLGYSTTHYRFRTVYDMELKVMGMGQKTHNDTVADTWTTTAIGDAGLGAWLRREPPRTGIADLDELIASEMAKGIQGVPLKMTSVTTSKDQKGREQTSTMTMEVTSLKKESVPASTFAMPAGYTETQMMPAMPPG
jgi:hypothetical protein